MKWLDFAAYIFLKHVYHRLVKQVKSVNKQYLNALINMNKKNCYCIAIIYRIYRNFC